MTHLDMVQNDFIEYDDGDDHTFICEQEDAEHYASAITIWYRLCGHKLTVEGKTDRFEDIVFCQSKPMLLGGVWVMVADPTKVLCNAFMVPPQALASETTARKYLSQVFLGRSIVHAGEPYIGPMFERLSKEYPANPKVLDTDEFRMMFGGLWLRTSALNTKSYAEYVTQRNGCITSENNSQYCEMWGLTHDVLTAITTDPLPPLSDCKRSTYYSGNPISLGIDTITEWGIVTPNIL